MEREPQTFTSVEEYERQLGVRLVDFTHEQLKKQFSFVFVVAPDFRLYLSQISHDEIFRKCGVSPDATLTEGNCDILRDGTLKIIFKHDIYQPVRSFRGTDEEFDNLKQAVRKKFMELR